MVINNILFNVELSDILSELIAEMRINHIEYIQKTKETQTHIQVCCPYHNNGMERRPSAGIRKSDGKFHCFACNEVHDLPEVISYCLGHTDDIFGKYGMKWLLKNFANIRMEERKGVQIDCSRVTRDSFGVSEDKNVIRNYISEEELDKYRYYHKYWTKRGITDEHLIELFDLGYDKSTYCITFPVRDVKGRCLFVARRSVKTKYFNYPKDVEKPLYGLYEYNRVVSEISKGVMFMKIPPDLLNSINELIICESMLDALTCWQYGRFALALNGLGSDKQFDELRKLPCRKLILATDNDEKGMLARQRIRKNVRNKIITEYILPEGKKDINDLTKQEFEQLEEVL